MSPKAQESQSARSNDKRYLPRWKVENRVLYHFESDPTTREAITRDLSGSGTCICINEVPPVDTKIKLKIELSLGSSVTLFGNVMWADRIGDKIYLGINFYNTSEAAQNKILDHAFELNKKQVLKHWFGDWYEGIK